MAEQNEQNYRLLGRLQADCEYFLGYGNRNEKYLWAKNTQEQIQKMQELYDAFPDDLKPEWCTQQDIDNYKENMENTMENTNEKNNDNVIRNVMNHEIEENDSCVIPFHYEADSRFKSSGGFDITTSDGSVVRIITQEDGKDIAPEMFTLGLGKKPKHINDGEKMAEEAYGEALNILKDSSVVPNNIRKWANASLDTANKMIAKLEESGYKPFEMETAIGTVEFQAYSFQGASSASNIRDIEGYDTNSDVIRGGGSNIYSYASDIVNAESLQKAYELNKVHLQDFYEKNVLPVRGIPYNEQTQEQREIMSMYSDMHKDCYFHRPYSDERDVCYQHYLEKEKENTDMKLDYKKYEVTGYLCNNYSGIMENFETNDWSSVEEKAHEMLCNGNYTEIKNWETGKSIRIDPDTYLNDFEGEFPVKYDELENSYKTAKNTKLKKTQSDIER